MILPRALAVKTTSAQILPLRRAVLAGAAALTLAAGGCGLDADEETSTATTPTAVTDDGATGPSGLTGSTGPTGAGDQRDEE